MHQIFELEIYYRHLFLRRSQGDLQLAAPLKDNIYLSTHIAIPIPPPIQRVAKPFLTSLLIIS